MKIGGPRAAASATQTGSGRRARSASGFSPSVEAADTASPSGAAAGPGAVTSVSALLALQAETDAGQARQQAISRADDMLASLDELRLGLLSQTSDAGAAQRLHDIATRERPQTGEAALEDVLDQIEVRAAVELAKREQRERA